MRMMNRIKGVTKDSIASQRYATPRDFAVNSVTLRKWRHLIERVLNYDNEGSNYRLHQRVSSQVINSKQPNRGLTQESLRMVTAIYVDYHIPYKT